MHYSGRLFYFGCLLELLERVYRFNSIAITARSQGRPSSSILWSITPVFYSLSSTSLSSPVPGGPMNTYLIVVYILYSHTLGGRNWDVRRGTKRGMRGAMRSLAGSGVGHQPTKDFGEFKRHLKQSEASRPELQNSWHYKHTRYLDCGQWTADFRYKPRALSSKSCNDVFMNNYCIIEQVGMSHCGFVGSQ